MTGQRPTAALRQLADPRLEGASCTGKAPLFDVDELDDENTSAPRLASAARVCARCPVSVACRTVAVELGTGAVGVWGGQIHGRPGRVGRPHRRTT